MATLRVTVLVATLLGLALMATPRQVVAGPIPGAAAYSQCLKDWRPCVQHRQRCAECAVSCGEAQSTSPMTLTAGSKCDYCRTVKV